MSFRKLLGFLAALAIATHEPTSDASSTGSEKRVTKAALVARAGLAGKLRAKKVAFGDELFIRIFKEEGELEVWLRHGEPFELVKTYSICARSGDLGPKEKVGDEQAPEGFYSVTRGALNPSSSYHLAFNVGYPNAYDRAHHRTGSLIMVHGDCVSIGCFAMTDEGIDEIYSLADAALTPKHASFAVHIFPFRMTKSNMRRHASSKWNGFWSNLKQGYDRFETDRIPPLVSVEDGRYVF